MLVMVSPLLKSHFVTLPSSAVQSACSISPSISSCKGKVKGDMLMHNIFFFLGGGLRRFQHCTGHITTGSWKDRGNQYIQFVRVLYCKLPTNGKQLPAFPLEAVRGIEPRPQR